MSVWLSGSSFGAIAIDLDPGDRGEAGSSVASFAVCIGTIDGELDGVGPDASGCRVGGPGDVKLVSRGIIGVGEDGTDVDSAAGTGIGVAWAFCIGASATGVSGKVMSCRAGIATALSFMTSLPSDKSSTDSMVGVSEATEFPAINSVLGNCGAVGAIAVTRCDTARSAARNDRLIGMLRLRRSATGPFQIHELQLLHHQGEAVCPLTGRHESR